MLTSAKVPIVIIASCVLVTTTSPAQSQFDLAGAIRNAAGTTIRQAQAPTAQYANVPHNAIYQYGLGSVIVGTAPTGAPFGYKLMLLAVVPASTSDQELQLRRVVGNMVAAVGTELRKELDSQPSLAEAATTATKQGEELGKHFDTAASQVIQRTNKAFISASQRFDRLFGNAFPALSPASFLAIGLRSCTAPTCTLDGFARSPDNRSFQRFGKVHEWMKAKGMPGTNQAYIVDRRSVPTNILALPGDMFAGGNYWSIAAKLDHGYEWHADFSRDALRAGFVNAANKSRRSASRMAYISAELVGLSRELATHVGDVFDSPYAAAIRLPANPTLTLSGISDEAARARLTECVRLRGTFDPTAAGNCAGLQIDKLTMAKCLAGDACMPAFGQRVNLDSLALTANSSLSSFAVNAALPRIRLGKINDIATSARACAKRNDNQDPAYCLVKSQVGKDPKVAATLACIERLNTQGRAGLGDCAMDQLPEDQKKLVKTTVSCLERSKNDAKGAALCTGMAALPERSRKVVECAGEVKNRSDYKQMLVCAGTATGSREAACIAANQDDWKKASLCAAGDRLPAPVQDAMACAEKASSVTNFGICMVAKQGDGEAQRIAQCYIEGQGDPAAIAVCLVSQSLTLDQRIALECAAQTKGALPALAACIGGRLAAKEMAFCKGQRFAENKCFGENNELRKLAQRLGTDIGPNSVVAQVANVQLRILEAQYGPLLEAATPVVTDAIELATKSGVIPPLPDPNKPATIVPYVVPGAGPVIKGVENYCDHNPCPRW